MEQLLEPVELDDVELNAVVGGLLNGSLNNFANLSASGNNAASTGSGVNSTSLAVGAVSVVV